jgi:anti-anti-sigma factor
MGDDPFPVEWTGRQAIVAFPWHLDLSNAGRLRDRLLAVINRGAAVLIADMTDTVSCDHSAVEALARACQRALVSGTQVRLVVSAPDVRRVLSIEGLDRLVPIYPSLEAATAAGTIPTTHTMHETQATHEASAIRETQTTEASGASHPNGRSPAGITAAPAGTITPAVLWQLIDALGDGLVLATQDGKIALANRRCAEMFGYRREELIGLPVDALVPSDVRAAHQAYRAGYQQAPQPRPMAERVRLAGLRRDGATLPVEISLSPLPTASADFVLAVIRDAAETRRPHDLADLARRAVTGQAQAATDLMNRAVRHLFQVGLSLQTAASLPAEVVRDRLADALDQLDDVIHELRDYAFTSGGADPVPLGTG